MYRIVLLGLLGCQAQSEPQPGPTFGGDQRSGSIVEALESGSLPAPDSLTAAGVFSALPVALAQRPCSTELCLETRPAWLPDGELLVGISVQGVMARPPTDLLFVLDASGSVRGSEDVRAATVDIALDRLTEDDTLGLTAFTGVSETLVAPDIVTDSHREEVRLALTALDGMPAALAPLTEATCPTWSEVLAHYDGSTVASYDTGDTGADTGWMPAPPEEALSAWVEGILESSNEALGEALTSLWCTQGTAVVEGATDGLSWLPDGSEDRASRLVIVSDLQGDLPVEEVFEAADRGVGTSVLGITSSTNTAGMAQLASAPGAHMLDAAEPSAALESWDHRFDAWMAPTSWGLTIELAETSEAQWTLVRHVGTTDADGLGASSVFASESHGMLAVVLEPLFDNPASPKFVVQSERLDGTDHHTTWARVPSRLLEEPWGEGDDVVALSLAWRLALLDAITEADTSAWNELRTHWVDEL